MFLIAQFAKCATAMMTQLYINAESMQLNAITSFLGIVCQLLIWFWEYLPKEAVSLRCFPLEESATGVQYAIVLPTWNPKQPLVKQPFPM